MQGQEPVTEVTLWRCRRCGQWSHAKRDPIAHKPIRPEGEDAEPWEWRAEWCGPFDRWEAVLAESSARELPHIGEPIKPSWRDDIHPKDTRGDFSDLPF